MNKYTAVSSPTGNIKVADNAQVNRYTNTERGHEHTWYNPNSCMQGWHGDGASVSDKKFMADVTKK